MHRFEYQIYCLGRIVILMTNDAIKGLTYIVVVVVIVIDNILIRKSALSMYLKSFVTIF